ncbi:MAG: hypothetical protein NUV47_01740 [Patescibacteria group bacterium]|nr:hypothetical protein [Patescibacteria group bacterium]
MAQTQLEWSVLEHQHIRKNSDWYWAVGIITISIATTSVIFNNILFAIFTVISAFALCLVSAKKPQTLSCEISDRGVSANNFIYPFNTLESFWIDEHEHKIIFKSKKLLAPFIIIPIDEITDSDIVRDVLLAYLSEEEHIEPLSQKIMEKLGF